MCVVCVCVCVCVVCVYVCCVCCVCVLCVCVLCVCVCCVCCVSEIFDHEVIKMAARLLMEAPQARIRCRRTDLKLLEWRYRAR